jgi:hypothetical protein
MKIRIKKRFAEEHTDEMGRGDWGWEIWVLVEDRGYGDLLKVGL